MNDKEFKLLQQKIETTHENITGIIVQKIIKGFMNSILTAVMKPVRSMCIQSQKVFYHYYWESLTMMALSII